MITITKVEAKPSTDPNYKHEYVKLTVFFVTLMHLTAFYALTTLTKMHWQSFALVTVYQLLASYGVTMGAHRLFSHKCYKANTFLRFVLVFSQTLAGQASVYHWVRDHRLHHKFTDMDEDPYNPSRGIFFSHMGWIITKKHPAVIAKGQKLDMSDMEADKIVMFQHKYFNYVFLFTLYILPLAVSTYFWNEKWYNMFSLINLGYALVLHRTLFVNSLAHAVGTKPFNSNSSATDNRIVNWLTFGEGWHNYHHVFPNCYKASEYGLKWSTTTGLIELCARMGWAWDLKTPSNELVGKMLAKNQLKTNEIKLVE